MMPEAVVEMSMVTEAMVVRGTTNRHMQARVSKS